MKIFFVSEIFYPSQAGGTANVVYWLVKNLIKDGIEPTIVTTDKGIEPGLSRNVWIENETGRVMYVRTPFLIFPLRQTIISLLNFRKADVVHLSSIFFPACFVTAFFARVWKKKIVWSVHGELDRSSLGHSRFRKRIILWLIKTFLSRHAYFHSTSDRETESIKASLASTVKIIELPNYFEIPEEVGGKPDNYLLFIGRIHPIKALDNLIKALAISGGFLQSGHVLKIAGRAKAGYDKGLQKLITDLRLNSRIIFLGQIEGEQKQQLLADAHFTILPSHTENFGLAVVESLAQNTPVLASKGTPWKMLENENIGFWVENSPEELARGIDKIYGLTESEYTGFRGRCRNFVTQRYDIHKNIDRWLEFYKNMS